MILRAVRRDWIGKSSVCFTLAFGSSRRGVCITLSNAETYSCYPGQVHLKCQYLPEQLIVLFYWYLLHSINILLQSDHDILIAVGL